MIKPTFEVVIYIVNSRAYACIQDNIKGWYKTLCLKRSEVTSIQNLQKSEPWSSSKQAKSDRDTDKKCSGSGGKDLQRNQTHTSDWWRLKHTSIPWWWPASKRKHMLVFSAGLRPTDSHKRPCEAANKDLKLPQQ